MRGVPGGGVDGEGDVFDRAGCALTYPPCRCTNFLPLLGEEHAIVVAEAKHLIFAGLQVLRLEIITEEPPTAMRDVLIVGHERRLKGSLRGGREFVSTDSCGGAAVAAPLPCSLNPTSLINLASIRHPSTKFANSLDRSQGDLYLRVVNRPLPTIQRIRPAQPSRPAAAGVPPPYMLTYSAETHMH